jgi:hypothetical protein
VLTRTEHKYEHTDEKAVKQLTDTPKTGHKVLNQHSITATHNRSCVQDDSTSDARAHTRSQ